jgi:gliding motility-associated-like protein
VSLTIIEVPKPNQPTLSSEIPICANEDLKLYANPSLGTIQWTGPFNFSSTAWFNLIPAATAQSGTYSAWIVQNGCHSDTSDIYLTLQNLINSNEVKTPNVITPNNDQVNDYWDINETLKNCYDFELSIINRWGKLVFSGNKYGAKFTGIDDSGQTLINGVYFYTLTIENDIRHGFIHVTH